MTTVSQRDVVFTPFMLRVRGMIDGTEPPAEAHFQPSEVRSLARAVDDWFQLRIRSEHVISEANAMLSGRAPVFDLEDEVGTGRLAFTIKREGGWTRFMVGQTGRQGWVATERSGRAFPGPCGPAGPAALEDLLIDMLGPNRGV
jgi:hypothetical protein